MKWIKCFFFFSENLDLIEYELYEWTGERYRLKWASSFSLRWICMHFYSFNSFEKFLSRIHNIFLLLLPFPRYEGQKITMTIIFIFCISGLILIGVFVSLDSLFPIRFCQQVGLALIVPEIIGVKGTERDQHRKW